MKAFGAWTVLATLSSVSLATTVAGAQTANSQTDARDYEALALLPNNTVAALGYFRHVSSSDATPVSPSFAQDLGIFRASYILKFGNLSLVPFDAFLPVVDVTVYPSTSTTLHTSGLADASYLPTVGYTIPEGEGAHTYFGVTAYVTAPTGNYSSSQLVNIGDNRWRVQPQVAVGQRFLSAFTVEVVGSAAFYTNNSAAVIPIMGMLTNEVLQQDPTFSFEGHLAADLSKTFYASVSYYVAAVGKRFFDLTVNGNDVGIQTAYPQQTTQTLRFSYGILLEKQSRLLLQYNQDIEASGSASITRFIGARFSHVFF
jgi:hypothetical protein